MQQERYTWLVAFLRNLIQLWRLGRLEVMQEDDNIDLYEALDDRGGQKLSLQLIAIFHCN